MFSASTLLSPCVFYSGFASQVAAGDEALRALHAQVHPFLMRRTKTSVLADLPPKIIQDRVCVMSALQRRLYAAFVESSTALAVMVEQ